MEPAKTSIVSSAVKASSLVPPQATNQKASIASSSAISSAKSTVSKVLDVDQLFGFDETDDCDDDMNESVPQVQSNKHTLKAKLKSVAKYLPKVTKKVQRSQRKISPTKPNNLFTQPKCTQTVLTDVVSTMEKSKENEESAMCTSSSLENLFEDDEPKARSDLFKSWSEMVCTLKMKMNLVMLNFVFL